jgi:hypothetical protein
MLFTIKYRVHPGGMKTGLIEASSLEKARSVGARWCELETERMAAFNPVQFVGVEPTVLATEDILRLERPAPPTPDQVYTPVGKDDQLSRLAQRNMNERVIPEQDEREMQSVAAVVAGNADKQPAGSVWEKVKSLGRQ